MKIIKQQQLRGAKRPSLLAIGLGVILMSAQLPAPAQSAGGYQPASPPWKIASNQSATNTGTNLLPSTLSSASQLKKHLGPAVISDSLWGNLMLEIAINRDPVLDKYGVMVKLMNIGVMTGLYAVAMGTVYQTIYATASMNPPAPHLDSTAPGIAGIVFSGVAVITGASKFIIGHELSSHIQKREIWIRDTLDSATTKLAASHCEDAAALQQLKDLIGERASGEWVQIWRATHMSTEAHRIGMKTQSAPVLVASDKKTEGGVGQ